MPKLDGRKVLISRVDNSLSIIALLGPNISKITDGYAIWDIIQRPRRVSLTQYRGRNPFTMTLNLMFDGYSKKVPIEQDLRLLTYMAIPPQDAAEPIPVLLYGTLPFPSGGSWIIQNPIEYGDNVIWDEIQGEPQRLRQDLTLTLVRYTRPDKVEFTNPGEGLRPKTPTVIVVKKGDTLRRLAQKYYGDYTLWQRIAAANALKDPYHLVPGTTLRIP